MCDETTEVENAAYLAKMRLNRREAGMGAGAALAAMLAGCSPAPAPARAPEAAPAPPGAPETPDPPLAETTTKPAEETSPATLNRMITIETPDGTAQGFFVAPNKGRHPGVLVWPDVAGLRDAYETMATRLAAEGYTVLVVNQYYRSTKLPVFTTFSEWRTDEGRAKITPMREALTAEGIAKDGAAFVAWLDRQPEVDGAKKIATTGYCMGGPFALRTAAAARERVGVVASFHGGGLVTNEPNSPHALLPKLKAALLICIAQNDDEREPAAKTTLQQAASAAGVPAEIEVYPAQHGWCTLDHLDVYDEVQAERAWARMLATFQRYL